VWCIGGEEQQQSSDIKTPKGYFRNKICRTEMEQPKYKVVEADHNKGPVNECVLARSFSFSESESESESGISSSLDSDSFEEVTSSVSSSSSAEQFATEPLNDMSSLFQQLPVK